MKICEICGRKRDNRSFSRITAVLYISKKRVPLICNLCLKKQGETWLAPSP